MSTMALWDQASGVAPGLRDALRSLIGAAGDVDSVWRLGEDDVVGALGVLGQVRQLVEVVEVALVGEGVERGLPARGSWSVQDWVTRAEGARAPAPPVREVAQAVRVARSRDRVPEVVEAFRSGVLPVGKADQLARFEDQVAPVADPEEFAGALGVLLAGARDEVIPTGPEGRGPHERVPGLTERELAVAITRTGRLLKPAADLEGEDRREKAGRGLYRREGPAGMTTYRVVLDSEGAAVIDAAVAALSVPVTGPEGERDERSAAQRRADALTRVVQRGVSAPGEAPRSEKAQVHVTIPLTTLQGRDAHGGAVTMTGQVLAPGVARRMACDAGIIPVVLGGEGEVLDLGRSVRLFTPGQRRAVWIRDQGCTYPGCTMPPQWCDAHHMAWWSRGGGTDIDNAALLCQRHHTRVHQLDLTATITATGVTWHL